MATPRAVRAATAARRAQVVRMRVAGVPVSVIARELGVSESIVYNDVHRSMRARTAELDEAAAELRALEVEKLDTMERRTWGAVHREHLHIAASGKVALHPETEEPLPDDGATLAAIDRLVKISERRCRMLGLDAVRATTIAVAAVPSVDVNREIARVFAELIAAHEAEMPLEHSESEPER